MILGDILLWASLTLLYILSNLALSRFWAKKPLERQIQQKNIWTTAIHQTRRNSLIAFKFLFKTFFDKWVHEDLS